MGESMGESRDFSPENTLEDCLGNPEFVSELSHEECGELLELARARVVEIFDPDLKARYKAIIQKILLQHIKAAYGRQKSSINIDDSYTINSANGPSVMTVNVCEIKNFSDTVSVGVNPSQIARNESCGYLCAITDKEQRFWINLKMFILKQADGSELCLLFIADWYVIPALRTTGIGTQLQQLAQRIGQENDCSSIFCFLVPENPEDLERLIATNQKMGFQVKNIDGAQVAQKFLT
jgi:hypothetical protein